MKILSRVAISFLMVGFLVPALGPVTVTAGEIKVGSFVSAKGFGSRFVIMPWMDRARKDLAKIGSKTTIKAYWGGSLGKSPFQQYDLVKGGVADVAWVMAILVPLAGILMVSNFQYHSFKGLDLKGKVPFVAMLAVVMVFVVVSIDPAKVLLGVFMAYAFSGPVVSAMKYLKKRKG